METSAVDSVYVSALLQKAELCNNRMHQTALWFVSFAAIAYFLSKSEATTLSILGASVPIPRAVLIGAMPLLLAALFYSMSCFASLEDEYYKEIRQFVAAPRSNGRVLSPFQLKLLEAPSHYTYSELRDIAGSTRALSLASGFASLLLVLIYGLVPVSVVGYFVTVAFHAFGVSWMLAIEGLAVFLGLFGLLQLFENIGQGRK